MKKHSSPPEINILDSKILLGLILLAGIGLRFYNYQQIPFTHDEFSALFRLNFADFTSLINQGVKVDGHPAGIQVFLYYYTQLFGTEPWIVKLPFTLFGLGSILLIYLIGKSWFNETVALIAAAYLASIQYTVMYSVIARPYISGLFFALLMVHFWSKIMFAPQRKLNQHLLLFILFASLCTYNHHFSLLFAFLVGLSGLWFIPRTYLLKYLISGLLIFLLYVPHLPIFFYQLQLGGVSQWLGSPSSAFILEYLHYLFHFSPWALAPALALILFGLITVRRQSINIRLWVLSLLWFLIPLLIGYFYSIYVDAVLQFSVLIFSFPFLLFALFGFINKQKPIFNFIIISTILTANISTLVLNRKHYQLFNNSIYREILTEYCTHKAQYNSIAFVIDSHKKITQYYAQRLSIDTNFVLYDRTFSNKVELIQYLDKVSLTNDMLYLGSLSTLEPEVVPLIRDYFPNVMAQHNYFGGTTYLFSKKGSSPPSVIDQMSFENTATTRYAKPLDSSRIVSFTPPLRNHAFAIDSNHIWGPNFTIPLESIFTQRHDYIDIALRFSSSSSLKGVIIVTSLENNNEMLAWRSVNLNEFYLNEKGIGEWQKAHHSLQLKEEWLKAENTVLKVYLWNKEKRTLYIDDFQITHRRGNPRLHGLYQDF